jgi:hypothetical protein
VPLDLEREIDELYGVTLDEFVPARTRLAKALRAEGRRAEAARVQELRKPTLPAWTVNQLVRLQRRDADLLLDAGHRLREAQAALLAGGAQDAFADARRRLDEALRRLLDGARSILAGRASAAMLDRVGATLRAAALSEEARPELALGRLAAEVEQSGFDALAGAVPPPAKAPRRREDAARRRALERARAKVEAARGREAGARRAAEAAEREAARLRAEHAAAAAALAAAEAELGRLGGG